MAMQRREFSWGLATAALMPLWGCAAARTPSVAVAQQWQQAIGLIGLYAAASVVAFLAYGHDKSAAARNAWRVQERTLHLFALLGGWPGALAAKRLFRHKSSKASFQTTYWITVVLNCAALGWLLSPYGAHTLQTALALV